MKFFTARKTAYHTNPKLIDQVIYTPYLYDPPFDDTRQSPIGAKMESRPLLGAQEPLSGHDDENGRVRKRKGKFYTTPAEAEIFLFDYGTVVIWGMTEAQEKRFLSSMSVLFALEYCYVSSLIHVAH